MRKDLSAHHPGCGGESGARSFVRAPATACMCCFNQLMSGANTFRIFVSPDQ